MTYKSFLKENEHLRAGEHLISPNGYYRLSMQRDGNLVVYRGNDTKNRSSVLWASGPIDLDGDHFLIMQRDGNLVIYAGKDYEKLTGWAIWASNTNGKGPAYLALHDDGNICVYPGAAPKPNPDRALWEINKSDRVKHIKITSLDYDLKNGTMSDPHTAAPGEEQVAQNYGDSPQSQTMTGSLSYATTSGWSDSIEVGVTVTSTLDVEVPFVAEESLEVSVSVKNTYQRNNSTTTTKTVGWTVPCVVPGHFQIKVQANLEVVDITVPFTQKATLTYESGSMVTGVFDGLYSGTGTYLLKTTFGKPTPLPPKLSKEKAAV